jgi:hypothetical protein
MAIEPRWFFLQVSDALVEALESGDLGMMDSHVKAQEQVALGVKKRFGTSESTS